jgi:hypothetical protein
LFPNQKNNRDALKRAEPEEKAAIDLVLSGKFEQTICNLVPRIKNPHKSPSATIL